MSDCSTRVGGEAACVPGRQWVLSLPYDLRYRLAHDPGMVTAVYQVFMRAVFGDLRRRARVSTAGPNPCGAVTFVQRAGGSGNLNVHFHALAALVCGPAGGLPDGRVVYGFKRPWRDGTDRVILEPEEFIARLAALVPRPQAHTVRYSGVLAPAARWRSATVPSNGAALAPGSPVVRTAVPEESEPGTGQGTRQRKPRNYLWSELLKRMFSLDALACGQCGGRLRVLAAIFPPENARQILDCLGLPSRPPPIAPARPTDSSFDFA